MAVYIPKLCTHLVMDEIDLVAGLGAFGVSVLPVAFAVLRQSGRSSPRSMNCPDSIFLTRFPGMGELLHQWQLVGFLGRKIQVVRWGFLYMVDSG